MRAIPFRLRIALVSVLISGTVLASFGSLLLYLAYRQIERGVDTEIRLLASRRPGWFGNRGNYQRLDEAIGVVFGGAEQKRIILLVKDASGAVVHVSPTWPTEIDPAQLSCDLSDSLGPPVGTNSSLPPSGPPAQGRARGGGGRGWGFGRGGPPPVFTRIPQFQTVKAGDTEWRLGIFGTRDMSLVVGLDYTATRADLNSIRNVFFGALPIALFLVGLSGWLVAGRALQPLNTIAGTAERITARGLDQRIPPAAEAPEIDRLIRILNRMMDRLEASFQQAIRFGADASHELKTPLAIMQGELGNALQSAVPGSPQQQLLSNLLEETQRLKTSIRSLLLLAQADAGRIPIAAEHLDLAEELKDVLEDAKILCDAEQLTLDRQIEPHVRVRADCSLLRTAILNLIDNAAKYNEPGGKISVRLETSKRTARLRVGNTGPGIEPTDQPRVFDRFFRAGSSRGGKRQGSGLGLSLAREIALAHGGELSLVESRPGWTLFEMTLPLQLEHGQPGV
jgi:heavy metal sensor kinase